MKITVIVPSLNPDEKLLAVADGLAEKGFEHIIFLDDGSGLEHRLYFAEVKQRHPHVILLRHNKNLGKGRALKTAINEALNRFPEDIGVITVDGDNQHLPEDVLRCAAAMEEAPNRLILGARDFSGSHVPARSAFGNKVTAFAFRSLCSIRITDTQTGLRGIPAAFARHLLTVPGERFEFETNMLLEAKREQVAIQEVPIQTVYIEENASSHFNPLLDSISIYKQILKFLWSSLASFALDFLLFLLLQQIFMGLDLEIRLLAATAGARLLSSAFNYLLNKTVVFGNRNDVTQTMLRYYSLCVVQMVASYGLVYFLARLAFPTSAGKLLVDLLLFFIGYRIQREWVFREKEEQA